MLAQDIRLDDRVALVTGGARGLGKAMAAGLLRAGARVVVADVDNDALLAASSDPEWRLSNGRAVAVACDITRRIDCERAAERALEAFGRLDILVNNAGRGPNHVT